MIGYIYSHRQSLNGCLVMMNEKIESAISDLQHAVIAGNEKRFDECLTELDESAKFYKSGEIDEEIFEKIIETFELCVAHDSGGWDLLIWIQRKFISMSPSQRHRIRSSITDAYCRLKSLILVLEVAEWIGGFKDEAALRSVEQWLSQWERLDIEARRCVWSAIVVLEDIDFLGKDDRYLTGLSSIKNRYIDLLNPRL